MRRPAWLEKALFAIFGGSVDKDTPGQTSSMPKDQEAVAMDTFRRRVSSTGYDHYRIAPGFDYIHWKPQGKRRRRYFPDEYAMQCKLLFPYVKDVAYSGYLGLEEKRWAGIGREPAPLGVRGIGSAPRSLLGSRDILEKMGPGIQQ